MKNVTQGFTFVCDASMGHASCSFIPCMVRKRFLKLYLSVSEEIDSAEWQVEGTRGKDSQGEGVEGVC